VLGASVVAMGWPVAAGQTLTARVITEAGYDRSDVVIQAFIEHVWTAQLRRETNYFANPSRPVAARIVAIITNAHAISW
jgi:hypothetical protein